MTLQEVAARCTPVALSGQRLLEVEPALSGLLPDGALRRGTTVAVRSAGGSGTISLAVALGAAASRAGSWMAVVGLPSLGPAAAAQLGAALERVALVPVAGEQWAVVAGALLDSADIVVIGAPAGTRPATARRLAARARERGAVLVVVGRGWPEPPDLGLTVETASWEGLGRGFGHLTARTVEVAAGGRRAAARSRRVRLWLPGPDGRVVELPPVAAGGQLAVV